MTVTKKQRNSIGQPRAARKEFNMTNEQQKEMETLLWELHKAVLEATLSRITDESAKSSDLATAVKFLKDNRITIDEAEDNEYVRPSFTHRLDLPFPLSKGDPDDS